MPRICPGKFQQLLVSLSGEFDISNSACNSAELHSLFLFLFLSYFGHSKDYGIMDLVV